MSFWDSFEEQNEIFPLLQAQPPDYDAILLHPELFVNFRNRNQQLIDFLVNPENANKLFDMITSHKVIRISRIIVELVVANRSVLLDYLLDNTELVEKMIKKVNECDPVHMGFITKIFGKALDTDNEKTKNLFFKSDDILVILTKALSEPAVNELILKFIQFLQDDQMWIVLSYLELIHRDPKVTDQMVIDFCKKFGDFKFGEKHVLNILNIIYEELKNNKINEFKDILNDALMPIYNNDENVKIRCKILQIAFMLPLNPGVMNMCTKIVQKEIPHDEQCILALNLLSTKPRASFVKLLPVLIN